MDGSVRWTEQNHLPLEIGAVLARMKNVSEPQTAGFEAGQGGELLEKAIGIGFPKESYAALDARLAAHGGKAAERCEGRGCTTS